MAFTYSGSTSQSITVTSTSGPATAAYQIAKTRLSPRPDRLHDVDHQSAIARHRLADPSERHRQRRATFKAQLQTQYAKYQAAIESANNTLTLSEKHY